jgi:Ring finger domain
MSYRLSMLDYYNYDRNGNRQERYQQMVREQERLSQEREQRERLRQERFRQERLEQERLHQDRMEQQRLYQERLRREQLQESMTSAYSTFGRIFMQYVSDSLTHALQNLGRQIETSLRDKEKYQKEPLPSFLYKHFSKKEENSSCPICFEDYEEDSVMTCTDCVHFFHKECLQKWIDTNSTCPICRQTVE